VFNNNNRSPGPGGAPVAQAAWNADMLKKLLSEAGG
jgi:hypothetical protein